MKIRSIWNGTLKISLVQVPVRVHTAVNNSEQIKFNQLHKNCHQRARQKLVCPVHGEIDRADIVKGYEYDKEHYCVVDEGELEQVRLETTRVINLVQFVRLQELDLACLDTPYLLTPAGRVGVEGFCVLREALRRTGRIGLGQVVLSGRERLTAVVPVGKGLGLYTLRYASELRSSTPYFEGLPEQVDKDQLALAQKLVESRSEPLDLSRFTDRYQTGLLELIQGKVAGHATVSAPPSLPPSGQIIQLMDALKESVAQARTAKRPEKGAKRQRAVA